MMSGMDIASRSHVFVGGRWAEPRATGAIDVVNPATEQTVATVPAGSAADIDDAVGAARAAAGGWAATRPGERAAILQAAREALAARADEAAALVSTELGAPLALAQRLHVGLPVT